MALEREFNVSLPDAVLVDVRTVQDVIDLLRERIQAPSEVAVRMTRTNEVGPLTPAQSMRTPTPLVGRREPVEHLAARAAGADEALLRRFRDVRAFARTVRASEYHITNAWRSEPLTARVSPLTHHLAGAAPLVAQGRRPVWCPCHA